MPIGEAQRIVLALREIGRPVEYTELKGEGHEFRRSGSRKLLIQTMVRFVVSSLSGPRAGDADEIPGML